MERGNIATKKRGLLLFLFLMFTGIGIISLLFSLTNPAIIEYTYKKTPPWIYSYTIFSIVLSSAIFVGVLKWKKWALYVFIFSSILTIFMQIFIFPQYLSSNIWVSIIPTLTFSTLWFWAIYRKWKNFD